MDKGEKMNKKLIDKYFDMFDKNSGNEDADQEYIPDLDISGIEVDNRRYSKKPDKIIAPVASKSNQSNNNPIFSNPKKTGVNGKSISEFINDFVYYNSKNIADPGNYVDGVAIGTYFSKYGKGLLEKGSILIGSVYLVTKAKKHINEKYSK